MEKKRKFIVMVMYSFLMFEIPKDKLTLLLRGNESEIRSRFLFLVQRMQEILKHDEIKNSVMTTGSLNFH